MKIKYFHETLFTKIVPPRILIPLAIAGIIIIVISASLEYRSRSNDYITLLRNQSTLFIETVANVESNILKMEEELETQLNKELFSQLKLIGELDNITSLSINKIDELLHISQFNELQFYDSRKFLAEKVSTVTGYHKIIPQDLLQAIIDKEIDKMLVVIPDSLNQGNYYIAMAIPRKNGGVLAGVVDFAQIQSFRKIFGFGRFIQQFQTKGSVEYIILENKETILAGVFNGYKVSRFADDPFLEQTLNSGSIKTRIVQYDQHPIFEAVSPFTMESATIGALRLGFSMREFEQLDRKVKRRFLIFGGVLFLLGLIFLNFSLSYRHRQLLREDLANLQHYTNVILENLGSGVIAVTKQGEIQTVNKQAAFLLNADSFQFFGKPYSLLPELLWQPIRLGIELGEEIKQPLVNWFTSGEHQKRIAVRTTLLKRNSGPETCIVLLDDVTEQTRLEEQINRQEKLTAMGKLASVVAHEIRNPLNSIGLIIQLLDRKYAPREGIEKYKEYVSTVGKEINRISSIVDQFMKFARPPALKLSPLKFHEFFSEIESLFTTRMNQSQIEFKITMEKHPDYSADHEQLKQVFVNLIENSIQSIEPPGIILITGKLNESVYEISVEDTGCGIPEGNRNRIFDLYFTTKKNGTGVGLAVVHQIISRHNGTIEVKNRINSGTIFMIRFPFASPCLCGE